MQITLVSFSCLKMFTHFHSLDRLIDMFFSHKNVYNLQNNITNECYKTIVIINTFFFQSEIINVLPKSSHVTKDTMTKLLKDFLENQAKRHIRSSADLDINFHLYKGRENIKEKTINIETLNSDNFKDTVFNNTEVCLSMNLINL